MAGQPVPLASVDKGRLRATLLRQLEIDLQESYMNGRDDPKSLLSLLSMERKGELSEDSPVPALRLRIMTMKSPWAGSQGHSYLISIEEKDGTLLTQRFLSAPFPIRAPSPPKTESVPG
jgi:hypothetical protein